MRRGKRYLDEVATGYQPIPFNGEGEYDDVHEQVALPAFGDDEVVHMLDIPAGGIKAGAFRATCSDIIKYGASEGCNGCRATDRDRKNPEAHSFNCRNGTIKHIFDDGDSGGRVEFATEKILREEEPSVLPSEQEIQQLN